MTTLHKLGGVAGALILALALCGAEKLRVVPGFQVASLYLEGVQAAGPEEFRSTVKYRISGEEAWRDALPLVLNRGEKSARSSLVKLPEDAACEVQIEAEDHGVKQTFSATFRTAASQVKVARTVVLDPRTFKAPRVISDGGSPEGFVRYTAAPGAVLDGGRDCPEVIKLSGAKYVILEGLTLRGGHKNSITVENSSHVRIVNCDLAAYGQLGTQRTDLSGGYYVNGRRLNYDSGVAMRDSSGVLVERCYFHDPVGRANPWFYSHPAGPNGVFIYHVQGATLRYNDFVGGDVQRWNDAVEGGHNGDPEGGPCADAEICGNYFALTNDDGIELDGGQMNCRLFGNKFEFDFGGVSTAPCILGPSYVFDNLLCPQADVYGRSTTTLKNNHLDAAGQIFYFNNTVADGYTGGFANRYLPEAPFAKDLKATFTNNVICTGSGAFITPGTFKRKVAMTRNLVWTPDGQTVFDFKKLVKTHLPEDTFIYAKPRFADPAAGDYALKPGTPGSGQAAVIPNFLPGGGDVGALQSGDELPRRPLALAVRPARLALTAAAPEAEFTVHSTGFRGRITVCKNATTGFLHVTPQTAEIAPGNEVTFKVRMDAATAPAGKKIPAVLLVRTPEGWSRPVAVTADFSADAGLVARDRQAAVFPASHQEQDGVSEFTFEVPQEGGYYLFVFAKDRQRLKVAVDGGEFADYGMTGPSGTAARWWPLARRKAKYNSALPLPPGTHVFKVKGTDLLDAALAPRPAALLNAPFTRR